MDKRTLSKLPRNIVRRNGKPMGHPLFDGKDPQKVWADLCEAWSIDCNDVMACQRARISVKALHRYLVANPKLREEKDFMKGNMLFKAKQRMMDSLSSKRFDGFEASRFVIERRDPDYKQKSAVAIGEDKDNPLGTLAGALIAHHKGDLAKEKAKTTEPKESN